MPTRIRSIETALPPTVLEQGAIRDVFAGQDVSRLSARLIHGAFDAAQIDTRHTVVAELDGTPRAAPVFFDAASGSLLTPSTGTRNAVYAAECAGLAVPAARRALEAAAGLGPDDVTHVVSVSCTGFFAPGPDYELVRALGLRPSVQRYHLGFMGCYAAFPALRAADQFCRADPEAVVLVVCVELCSLHLGSSENPDRIVASAVFADGAAAAVVTARDGLPAQPVLTLDAFETTLTPVGEQDMAWTIGDHGFEMVLSRYVPHIVAEHITAALAPLRGRAGAGRWSDVEHWAIHPGGRAILDRVEDALELRPDQLSDSRTVLREVGNLSSATILFVLRRLLHATGGTAGSGHDAAGGRVGDGSPHRVCAMAFGPGLTVESALLTREASA